MESIVVIRRTAVFDGDWPQGFVPASAPAVSDLQRVVATAGFVVDRDLAEHNPAWKQPIPYCILLRGPEVFCVERLPRQGEGRLHGRLSLGLGGHIGPADAIHPSGPVLAGLGRELQEEVGVPVGRLGPPRLVGLINDDSDEVGRVHFGLVFALAVPADLTVEIVESPKMRGGFRHLVGPSGLWQDLPRFESWSRILLEARAVEALACRHADPARHSPAKTQEEPSNG